MSRIAKQTLFLFACILMGMNPVFPQNKQNNQWRFGVGGALDFNTLPPSFVAGCPISTTEGSASVADRITGALLFYTDGVTVWNANNQVMPNGTGLLGGVTQLSSTTAAVIVPKPGSSNLFFIVTVDEIPCINGVRYSVVDMTLNGGLGDIVVGQKNIFLMQTTSEKLEVVPACDGLSLWLIACSSNNEFVSFRIDNTGIQTTPVIGAVFQNGFAGHNKINRQFNKIAVGCCTQMEVFDFDNATGIVSNPIVWNANLPSGLTWGIEFSPDGKVLYTSDGSSLLQFDLTQTTPLAIQNSEYLVSSGVHYTLQLGIDEKIYCNSGSISAINFPNNLGVACGYQANVIPNQTGGVFGASGLPKWVYYADDDPISTYNPIVFNNNCFPGPVQFWIADTTAISSITWNFGDPNTGTNNTAVGDTAFHTFSQIGIYNVQAILTTTCGFDTLFTDVAILNPCNPVIDQCDVYQYTGAVQQWTVPSGVDTIRVKMWGAAGGGGPDLTNNAGGGGGYTEAVIPVNAGQVIEIYVGGGGIAADIQIGGAGGWPNGGNGGSGNRIEVAPLGPVGGSGGGGGRSEIRIGGTSYVIAGGGGGGTLNRNGGAGGGLEAEYTVATNNFNIQGFGGTQIAGGAPASNTICGNPVSGIAGASLQGGNGATDLGGTLNDRTGGGGGGDGYFGGGGGSSHDGCFGVGSAGGGGSGYLCSTCPGLTGLTLTQTNFTAPGSPANETDPLLAFYPGVATGTNSTNGGNGLIQICYTSAPCSPTTATILATSCTNYTAPWGASFNQTGIYFDTIVNNNGCDSIIQLNLTITGLPALTTSSGSGTCGQPNGTATASATGGAGNYAYNWSNGATGSFITGLSSGSYSVIATDQNGCSSTSQVIVSTSPAAGVTLTAGDTILGINESVTLTIDGGDTYNWSPATGLNCTDCPTVIASPQSSTTYTVTGTDSVGCPYLRVVNVVVDIICGELFVPDIFSPNGIGNSENEKLCVYSNCIKSMNLGIYNRWGELIFSTDNQNDCWDGTNKGVPVMTGVYAYRLFLEQFDGEKIEKTGTITLTK
jgi:gliding motility-associated-like protein